jgi:two-component system cell cycle sensor histidine kinase/response regulator CckA
MPPNIEIRSRQATDLPTVRADTAQIQQVLMNLIMNARDALAGGGVLRIDTLTESLAESGIAAKPDAHSREYVVIVVSDTGIGMDEETLRRIFEPFFTTKDKGKGTGLGLAMVYGVVKNHGGFVKVTSEVGRGATFRVFLPVCGEPEALPELHEEQTHPLGTETLLVVDDEPDIREFIRDIFTEYGYTVFTAANGLEAVEIFKNQAGRIELVILDMVMPKMDGPETFRRLRKIDPTVKALLSSGYSQDGQAQKLMQEGVVGFLQKPYQVDRLLACVREVLGPLRSC